MLVEERIETNGIPPRLYIPSGAEGLLLLGHGGGKSKDSDRFANLSRLYAEGTGLAVICIDAVDHGERKPVAVQDRLPAEWHSNAVGQMVDDWAATARLSRIGPALAYVGFSMGSIFGVPVVVSQTSIKVAVSVAGGGSVRRLDTRPTPSPSPFERCFQARSPSCPNGEYDSGRTLLNRRCSRSV